MESILLSVKKRLGVDPEFDGFDEDIISSINSAFMNLNQLAIGPTEGFSITSIDEVWTDFSTATNLQSIKNYVFLKVRLAFDPPQTSFGIEAIKSQILELEWRLNIQVDTTSL